eukprot:m.111412 g.111412  ORF g.111412 m.111412 type:complete len:934 (-) comp13445_c0_seq1:538-3339(-)
MSHLHPTDAVSVARERKGSASLSTRGSPRPPCGAPPASPRPPQRSRSTGSFRRQRLASSASDEDDLAATDTAANESRQGTPVGSRQRSAHLSRSTNSASGSRKSLVAIDIQPPLEPSSTDNLGHDVKKDIDQSLKFLLGAASDTPSDGSDEEFGFVSQQSSSPPHLSDVDAILRVPEHYRGTLSDYKVLDTIGEGSFASVKRAVHIASGCKVALKIVNKEAITQEYVAKTMRREGNILKKLQHKHIGRLYEVIETAKTYCLVMELAAGGEVLDYIVAHEKLSEKEAKRCTAQLIMAIDYLHVNGIIHRDLKGENLLLDKGMDIKLVDFGLSNTCGPGCFLKTQCGSPSYSAPELLGGKSYDKAVDIWSIGVNLYAMLTGKLPFSSSDPTKLHALILDSNYAVPQNVSEECIDLVSKLLVPKPKKRISMVDLKAHPWFTGVSFEEPQIYSPPSQDSLHSDVLNHMVTELGYDRELVVTSVTQNACDGPCACYALLLKRYNATGAFRKRDKSAVAGSSAKSRPLARSQTESRLLVRVPSGRLHAPPSAKSNGSSTMSSRNASASQGRVSASRSRQLSISEMVQRRSSGEQLGSSSPDGPSPTAVASSSSSTLASTPRRRTASFAAPAGSGYDSFTSSPPSVIPSTSSSTSLSHHPPPPVRQHSGSFRSTARQQSGETDSPQAKAQAQAQAFGGGNGADLSRRRASIHGSTRASFLQGLRKLYVDADADSDLDDDPGSSRGSIGNPRARGSGIGGLTRSNTSSSSLLPTLFPPGDTAGQVAGFGSSSGCASTPTSSANAEGSSSSRSKPRVFPRSRTGSGSSVGGVGRSRSNGGERRSEPHVRAARFPLNSRMVSHKRPSVIFDEVQRCLSTLGLTFTVSVDGGLRIRCQSDGIVLSIEIVRLKNLSDHGVHFKRVGGDPERYRDLCNRILDNVAM